MATAKKLPSGSWRVRTYSHTENDRQIYESFTAPTKKEAELKAAEWQNKRDRHRSSDLTVYEAIEGYINAKEGVLSPSSNVDNALTEQSFFLLSQGFSLNCMYPMI